MIVIGGSHVELAYSKIGYTRLRYAFDLVNYINFVQSFSNFVCHVVDVWGE